MLNSRHDPLPPLLLPYPPFCLCFLSPLLTQLILLIPYRITLKEFTLLTTFVRAALARPPLHLSPRHATLATALALDSCSILPSHPSLALLCCFSAALLHRGRPNLHPAHNPRGTICRRQNRNCSYNLWLRHHRR